MRNTRRYLWAGILCVGAGVCAFLGYTGQRHVSPADSSFQSGASELVGPEGVALHPGVRGDAPQAVSGSGPPKSQAEPGLGCNLEVLGKVVTEDGAPIRGARAAFAGTAAQWIALSGDDGKFTIAADARDDDGVFSPDGTELAISLDGFATARRVVHPQPGRRFFTGDVVLVREATLRGRVNSGGRPVQGASIRLYSVGFGNYRSSETTSQEPPRATSLGAVVESASDGTFHLRGLPRRIVDVWVAGSGFKTFAVKGVDLRSGYSPAGDLIIQLEALEAWQQVRGQVITQQGDAVEGARITSSYQSDDTQHLGPTAHTDATGRFELVLTCNIPHRLLVSAPTHALKSFGPESVAPGAKDLVLTMAYSEQARLLVRGPNGEPVPNGRVLLLDEVRHGAEIAAHAVRDGAAHISIPSTDYRIRILCPGYRVFDSQTIPSGATPASGVFALSRGGRILGAIASKDGPLSGAEVSLVQAMDPMIRYTSKSLRSHMRSFDMIATPASLQRTISDQQGRYEFVPTKDHWYAVVVTFGGRAVAWSRPFATGPDAPDSSVDVNVESPGAIVGAIAAAETTSLAGSVVGISNGYGTAWTTTVDESGAFVFDVVPPGRWQAGMCPQGSPPTWFLHPVRTPPDVAGIAEWDCLVLPGETCHVVVPEAPRGSCVLAGRFTLDGSVPDAWKVVCIGADSFARPFEKLIDSCSLDSAGRFVLHVPSDTAVRLWFRGPDDSSVFVLAGPCATTAEQDVRLESGSLRVRGVGDAGDGQVYVYESSCGPGMIGYFWVLPTPTKDVVLPCVPVGRGRIVTRPFLPRLGLLENEWTELAACEVRSGEQTELLIAR